MLGMAQRAPRNDDIIVIIGANITIVIVIVIILITIIIAIIAIIFISSIVIVTILLLITITTFVQICIFCVKMPHFGVLSSPPLAQGEVCETARAGCRPPGSLLRLLSGNAFVRFEHFVCLNMYNYDIYIYTYRDILYIYTYIILP